MKHNEMQFVLQHAKQIVNERGIKRNDNFKTMLLHNSYCVTADAKDFAPWLENVMHTHQPSKRLLVY